MRKFQPTDSLLDSHISKKSKTHTSQNIGRFEVQLTSLAIQPKTNTSTTTKMLANRNKSKTEMGQSAKNIAIPDWMPSNPLNQDLFTEANIELFQQQYNTAKPYRHVQFPTLCTHDAMAKIQREIIQHLPTTSRETDLFKVNQSIDLNNVDLASSFAQNQIPTLMSLRTYLYSLQFRQFLQQITTCSEIIDTVDCAANIYSGEHGNHLLTHDDVISSRVLSYIIYLPLIDQNEATSHTAELQLMQDELQSMIHQSFIDGNDKEDKEAVHFGLSTKMKPPQFDSTNATPWTLSMGGHLELFDKVNADILPFGVYPSAQDHLRDEHRQHDLTTLSKDARYAFNEFITSNKHDNKAFLQHLPPKAIHIPLSIPSKCLTPNFNTMVVFEVKPQSSYHAVQEVYSINSKRISIQGWFHQEKRQPDYGATLRLLQIPTLPPTHAIVTDQRDAITTLSALQPNTVCIDSKPPAIHSATPNDRNIYDLVIKNQLSELNQDELSLVTRDLFPERCFQLFKYFNEPFLHDTMTALDSSADNNDEISNQEIDYLSKIILLHVYQVMLRQQSIQKEIFTSQQYSQQSTTPTTTSTIPSNNTTIAPAHSSTTTTDHNNDTDSVEDVDLYAPELIKSDLQFLRKFISQEYTSVSILRQLQTQWKEQSVIQLGNFLQPELIQLVIKSLIRTDVVDRIALLPDYANFFANAEEEDSDYDEDQEVINKNDQDEDDLDLNFDQDEDDLDFNFDDDEDNEGGEDNEGVKSLKETTISKPTEKTSSQTSQHTTLINELFESTPVLTQYTKKIAPPAYDVGITPLSVKKHANGKTIGGWKLSGPAYLQRYAYFESIFHRETHHLLSHTADAASTLDPITTQTFSTILTYFNSLDVHIKAGLILEALTKFLFGNVAFTRIIEWITDLRLLCYRSTIRRFRCGLDYSVGNYNDMIECSDVNVLQSAIVQANEQSIENSTKFISSPIPAIANIIDIDSLTPSSLSMLDIVLSFADNGSFDHLYSQNLWETDQDLMDIENNTFNDEDDVDIDIGTSSLSNDSLSTQMRSSIILEHDLYPNAKDDVMIPDITPYLEQLDESVYQLQALQSNGMDVSTLNTNDSLDTAFATIPPCHVRFKQKQSRWESDDAGGFSAYIPVDITTEGDDAQQYIEQHGDDEEQLISLSLSTNTLTLCKHKPNVLNFVRYVNFHSPGSRWDISLNCIYQNDNNQ